jgi:AraC family transcriptional regulator of adaptative response / DNA-3-methyladenine glycosylase II
MPLDPQACQRAYRARDPRFDGRFFIGVRTTGIYCRPVCPAPPPRPENVRFYPSAAAAAAAGFRPCLRCRPEAAPGSPAWQGTSATVDRALRVLDGDLDGGAPFEETASEALARRVGVTPRHLNRLFRRHLGAPVGEVIRTRRLHAAKRLIDETALPMADVAFAAGFASVRRFNAALRRAYGRPPSELRRTVASGAADGAGPALALRLPYRAPLAWTPLLAFLAARAIPGVEEVEGGVYRRAVALGDGDGEAGGVVELRPVRGESALLLTVHPPLPRSLPRLVARARRLFDLDADPAAVAARLGSDPLLAPALAAHPGLRLPGAWDGFELAVRAVLGQQVSVRAATTLAGRLVAAFGRPLQPPSAAPAPARLRRDSGPDRLFPRPEDLAEADLGAIGLTRARAVTLRRLATAAAAGEIAFDGAVDAEELAARLVRLPGIGDWTAQYIAMRALGAPDAFPASDLGLLKAAGEGGAKTTPARLRRRAEAWRPWRAYAAICLWTEPPKPTQ